MGNSYLENVLEGIRAKNANEPEFLQATSEVLETIKPAVEKHEQELKRYLVSELKNSYPDVYETLQNVPNTAEGAYQAAYKWTTDFEIPADKYSEGENRGDNAQTTYWEKYGSK